MHRGRPFAIEQQLRAFAPSDLYSSGWAALAYAMSTGTYGGTLASLITTPAPDLTFSGFDADFLGGDYKGVLYSDSSTTLEVGFHFRINSTGEDTEGWIQTYVNGARCLNEPSSGQNHINFMWNAVSIFPSTSAGPHWAQLHPDHVVWDPKGY